MYACVCGGDGVRQERGWCAARACRRKSIVHRVVSIMLWPRSVAAVKRAMALHAKVPTIVKFAEAFLAAVEQVLT
jgi:hypothetical protein